MKNEVKVLIVGHARHGKDTLAEILQAEFNLSFKSSSLAASEIFLYDAMKDKYGYETPEECFEDRVNHREEWHNLICEYNKDDKARLAKDIMRNSDCYVGMRSSAEIKECMNQNIFDIIVWVDASERLPLEDRSSFNIDRRDADIIIENNGNIGDLIKKAKRVFSLILGG